MTNPITIRPAEMADCDAIATLMSQLYREEGYERTAQGGDIEMALFGPMREVNTQAFIALSGDSVVAAMLYYPGYDTMSASIGYHLADIVVSHTHRRQAVGKALLQQLAATALAEKKEWLSLTVLKTNAPAREFYRKLGLSDVAVDFFALGEIGMGKLASGNA